MATKSVRVAELKNHLSEHLRSVERGAKILVLDRDRPIAQIIPIEDAAQITIVPPRRPFGAEDKIPGKRRRLRISSLELLLEERQDR